MVGHYTLHMLNHQFRDMNSVQLVENIILVGEKHKDARSEALLQSVLGSVEGVDAVAVERHRASSPRSSRTPMDTAEDYARDCDLPRYYIDKSYDWLQSQISDYQTTDVISDGNIFSVDVKETGNVDIKSICDSRSRIFHKYGEDTFDALFTDREKHMARQLNWLKNEFDGYVLTTIGVFHIFAVVEFMDLLDSEKPEVFHLPEDMVEVIYEDS